MTKTFQITHTSDKNITTTEIVQSDNAVKALWDNGYIAGRYTINNNINKSNALAVWNLSTAYAEEVLN